MTLLITGASGFIGSYLCSYFFKMGHTVIATARDPKKIPSFESGNRFVSFELDVLQTSSFNNVSSISIDAVIHTATSNDILSKNTSGGILLSTVGTRNVLEFCLQRKIPKLIFFSTFQVYGTELNGDIDETSPTLCRNDYGLNHLFGEQYVEMYAREKGITGIVVRPSNVYGRFSTSFIDRWTLVPGCFCQEVYHKGTITLLSSGRQIRNFVGLHEVSAGVEAIVNYSENGFAVYNVASDKNLSMLAVAEMVKEIFEERYRRTATIHIKGEEPKSGNSFSVNLEKIQSIGYQPDDRYNLKTEINKIFGHLEKMNNEPNRTI
jgi:UDP-glucose 4-epimerase